jgi:SagB-type dehydrogenase family enzyme
MSRIRTMIRCGATLGVVAVAGALGAAAETGPMRTTTKHGVTLPAPAKTAVESKRTTPGPSVALPTPLESGTMSLEEALRARHSVREFEPTPLTDRQLGQLLWAAQGVTHDGHRTAPSAGALYPLELYVASAAGFSHYEPEPHRLTPLAARDLRAGLRRAAYDQAEISEAPATFVIAAVFERTAQKYGERSARYVPMEAGHAAQNLLLEATALGLGAVPMGAFDDVRVAQVLDLPGDQKPLYLIPVGRAREK